MKNKNYWTRLLKVVRQEWSRNNLDRKECFKKAQVDTGDFKKWTCNNCKNNFALSEVQCDHVYPINNTIPCNEEEFIESFKKLHSDNLQILCKQCHKMKTKVDVYNKNYANIVTNVANYLETSYNFIDTNIKNYKDLQKFDRIIKKIKQTKDERQKAKLEKQVEDLRKKLL